MFRLSFKTYTTALPQSLTRDRLHDGTGPKLNPANKQSRRRTTSKVVDVGPNPTHRHVVDTPCA